MSTALRDLVEKNLAQSRLAMRGAGLDPRVRTAKAGDSALLPRPPQIDKPASADEAPPALTAAASDMKEGVDLFERNHLNDLYQRYGPQPFHKTMRGVPAEHLHKHAGDKRATPDVKHALLAAAAVQKAFSGSNPGPSDNPGGSFPDTTPGVSIPQKPSAAGQPSNSGLCSNWKLQAKPVPRPAGFNAPGTWVLVNTPSPGGSGATVARQWVFQPATGDPVKFPEDTRPGGVGDDDRSYNDGPHGRYIGQPRVGDLTHFNGVGGSKFTARTVMVTTGHAIGEFNGQTVAYPLDAVTPHSVGGSDHATNQGTPGELATGFDASGGIGVGGSGFADPGTFGIGKPKQDGDEFGVKGGKKKKVKKALVAHLMGNGHDEETAKRVASVAVGKANSPYFGGTTAEVGRGGYKPPLLNPDDGAPLSPYTQLPPYNPDARSNDRGPGTNVQSGGLTPREYSLIDRVVSHRGPRPVESAALKAIKGGNADPEHHRVLRGVLREHAFAAPGAASACRAAAAKLG